MNRIHTYIIYLTGLLSLFIYICDTDTITIYLSNQTVPGTQYDLSETCNSTGLSRNEIALIGTCNSSPILAWIGAYASYSPWIEYKGCRISKRDAIVVQIEFTHKNVSVEPDIFKCFQSCQMFSSKNIYIGFQRYKCLCHFTVDVEEILLCDNNSVTVCGDNQKFICGENDNITVIYEIKNLDMILKNNTGECGIVQINGNQTNQTTFSSMKCSNKAAILCFDNGTLKAYPNKTENWVQTVKFCRTQDGLISSVENAMNGNLLNITDGTYWVAAIRGVSYSSLQDSGNALCVASFVINGGKMKPIVKSCDLNLPVSCKGGGSDRWNGSLRDCRTSTEKIYTTTDMTNVSVLSLLLNQRNLIITIASGTFGSIGFICLVLVTFFRISSRRNMKNKKKSGNPQHQNCDRDYDDLDPNRQEMHVYNTTQDRDYVDLDPNRQEMHVYNTTQDRDYVDLDPNRQEMHVYNTTQDRDYVDLDPNRQEMHVYNTTQDRDYVDLDPNRQEMHVYNTTQNKDYDDLDPKRKDMHVYNTTQ
ncbi:unnamed protein product [Mytilus coruscus]|uniref:Uncharacterized protein n=1 Tax=Mytilus coruscus TaxID=42192 RepID=A0A6J8CTE5_MYTCO|nr:unnamed protein product [Mytilus coruscus]